MTKFQIQVIVKFVIMATKSKMPEKVIVNMITDMVRNDLPKK
jgi:hypothetical protein